MKDRTLYQYQAALKAGALAGGPACNLACYADPVLTLNAYKAFGWRGVRNLSAAVRKFRANP